MARHFSHALVVCARWETECIVEWLCYHRHIGFDHVYLYCNDDDPKELYEAVLPFTGENGFVDFFHFGLQGRQREMYFHFLKNFVQECDWFMFLDVDEFLLLRNKLSIGEFIKSFQEPPDAINFFWRPAGHSGHITRPKGTVIPQYTKCGNSINAFTKVIVRTDALSENMIEAAGVVGQVFWHNVEPLMKNSARVSDVLGNDLRTWYYEKWPDQASLTTSDPDYSARILATGFIHHIAIKSEQDFIRRYERGIAGQFYGQAQWAELSKKGREAILEHLAENNLSDEYGLVEIWQDIINHSYTNQIVKAPPGRNLALGGTALQSSTSEWSLFQDPAEDAAGVIDGKPTGVFHHHTDTEFEPWWQVDLGAVFEIREIRLFNRIDNVRDRLRNLIVWGSFDGANWFILFVKLDDKPFGGIDGYPHIWQTLVNCRTRFVRVCGIGESVLDFDQVEVY